MYREPHLQSKSDECANIYRRWWYYKYTIKDEGKAEDIRNEWGTCVTELGEMVSHEVKTNPRYKDMRM